MTKPNPIEEILENYERRIREMQFARVRHTAPFNEATTLLKAELQKARYEGYKDGVAGICPECTQDVKDWKAPVGSFAPEMWATLREMHIDPTTGHKDGCKLALQGDK